MNHWDLLLAGVTGAVGFLVALALHRALVAVAPRTRWRRQSARIEALVIELVRLQHDVLLCEQELAELVDRCPSPERQRFAERVRDIAHSLAPLLLEQLRRFGLVAPPPTLAAPMAPEPGPEPGHVVVANEDRWGDES